MTYPSDDPMVAIMRTRTVVVLISTFLLMLSPLATAGEHRWTTNFPFNDFSIFNDLGVVDIAVDPRNPGRVWVIAHRSADTQLWRSNDAGTTWTQVPLPAEVYSIEVVAVDPTDSRTVYLGGRFSGPPNYSGAPSLIVSRDGGETWSALSTVPYVIDDLVIHPHNPSSFYVATRTTCLPNVPYDCFGGGVLRSQDGGASWKLIGFGEKRVAEVHLHPLHPNIVLTVADGAIYRSTDGGVKWSPIPTTKYSQGIGHVAFDPILPSVLYALGDKGILKSTDGGTSWRLLETGGVQALAVSASDPLTILAVTPYYEEPSKPDLVRSRDGGETWHLFEDGIAPGTTIERLLFDVTGHHMYAAGEHVVYSYTIPTTRPRAVRSR